MINTIETKEEQLAIGYYKIGTGNTKILILGSCRSVAYITYFKDLNKDNKYSIYFIDPMNWCWDMQGNRVNYEERLSDCEDNTNILELLKIIDIFIHEHYVNAGMFNVSKFSNKNIYQFGLNPKINIELPNFNDIFLLTKDIVSFDMDVRKQVIQDYNVNGELSKQTIEKIEKIKATNLQKFFDICAKTSFPEFAEVFANEYKEVRYFWTFNHVSARFTQTLFRMMCEKYLGIDLKDYNLTNKDLFANNYTYLSDYDSEYNLNESKKTLKEML